MAKKVVLTAAEAADVLGAARDAVSRAKAKEADAKEVILEAFAEGISLVVGERYRVLVKEAVSSSVDTKAVIDALVAAIGTEKAEKVVKAATRKTRYQRLEVAKLTATEKAAA